MAFTPGIDESRIKKLRDLIRTWIPELNTALTTDGLCNNDPLSVDNVVAGDVNTLWDLSNGIARIAVVGGGGNSGLDIESEIRMIDLGRRVYKVYTNIFVYLHPTYPRQGSPAYAVVSNPDTAEEVKEFTRSRTADFLRFKFNEIAEMDIILDSEELAFGATGTKDRLGRGNIERIVKGYFLKSLGKDIYLPAAHLTHVALVG